MPGWGKLHDARKRLRHAVWNDVELHEVWRSLREPVQHLRSDGLVSIIATSWWRRPAVNAISGWNGTGAASILTKNHTLTYGTGNNRIVLVG